MADQGHITFILDAHYSHHYSILFITPELNTLLNLILQFFFWHIRFMPPVSGNYVFVCNSRIIDDLANLFKICLFTFEYHKSRFNCTLTLMIRWLHHSELYHHTHHIVLSPMLYYLSLF